MGKRLTNKEIISRFRQKHGRIFNYSRVKYINMNTKIEVICPTHGSIWQTPKYHLESSYGCRKCSILVFDTDSFIIQSKRVHKDSFNYSYVKYVDINTNVSIVCNTCNNIFQQQPKVHLRGHGCIYCNGGGLLDTISYVRRAKRVFPNYNFDKTVYRGMNRYIVVTCHKHGDFKIRAKGLLLNNNCPKCRESRGEKQIRLWLESRNINYVQEKAFKGCVNINTNNRLLFDFYLPNLNTIIEYDGEQHFKSIRFNNITKAQARDNLERTRLKDRIKNDYCKENNIKLVRIPYYNFNNVEDILMGEIIV